MNMRSVNLESEYEDIISKYVIITPLINHVNLSILGILTIKSRFNLLYYIRLFACLMAELSEHYKI